MDVVRLMTFCEIRENPLNLLLVLCTFSETINVSLYHFLPFSLPAKALKKEQVIRGIVYDSVFSE